MISHRVKEKAKELFLETASPFYLMDFDGIKSNYQTFRPTWERFFPKVTIAYSYKSNSLKGLTQYLRSLGAKAEVVSGAELSMALEDGFLGEEIFFNGPLKTKEELALALSQHVNIHIDSIDQLNLALKLRKDLSTRSAFVFRLAGSYKGEKVSRFGLVEEELPEAFRLLSEAKVFLGGLHFHLGSNLTSSKQHVEVLLKYQEVLRSTVNHSTSPFKIDIGGGYPAKSISKEGLFQPLASFAKDISDTLTKINIEKEQIELVLEPGRAFVEDHGYLITQVQGIKEREKRYLALLDIGIHHVKSVHSWYHPIEKLVDEEDDFLKTEYDLCGYNCFESDLIAAKFLGILSLGDPIIIGSSGGYDMPNANAWIRSLPPVYGFSDEGFFLLRKQEDFNAIRLSQLSWQKAQEGSFGKALLRN